MDVVSTARGLAAVRETWAGAGESVVLVPTMGALHEGHFSLIQLARSHGQRVVVSIFVNPLQFGPHEDFERYPRVLEADLANCRRLGVDLVFAPSVEEMYPHGQGGVTQVIPPPDLERRHCGHGRPGHFAGVTTVVMKLFQLVLPHGAVFGEKDAQQLAIIQRMVQDLNVPVRIIPHPIVRDADGLALSSRNRYMDTPALRQAALVLPQVLGTLCHEVMAHPPKGEADWWTLQRQVLQGVFDGWTPVPPPTSQNPLNPLASPWQQVYEKEGIRLQGEYLDGVHCETFAIEAYPTRNTKLLAAMELSWIDGNSGTPRAVRLIDAMAVAQPAFSLPRVKGLV